MAKAGGNIRRVTPRQRPVSVSVEARPLLNLLKTDPRLFGTLPVDQLNELLPAVIFNTSEGLRCSLARPDTLADSEVHSKLVKEEALTEEQSPIVRAYLARAVGRVVIYPEIDAGVAVTNDLLLRLQQGLDGRAEVEMGGITNQEGAVVGLAGIVLGAIEILDDQNHAGRDFIAAEAAFAKFLTILSGS